MIVFNTKKEAIAWALRQEVPCAITKVKQYFGEEMEERYKVQILKRRKRR